MGQHLEYMDAKYVGVEYTDERNLVYADDPDAQNVLVLAADEGVVFTGTPAEIMAMISRMVTAIAAGPTPYDDPDIKVCDQCGDQVQYLSTDGKCDGCVAEAVPTGA